MSSFPATACAAAEAPGVRSLGQKRVHRRVGLWNRISGGRCPSRGHGGALTRDGKSLAAVSEQGKLEDFIVGNWLKSHSQCLDQPRAIDNSVPTRAVPVHLSNIRVPGAFCEWCFKRAWTCREFGCLRQLRRLVRQRLVPCVYQRAAEGSGPTRVMNVSALVPALAEICQHPSVGNTRPVAWNPVG
jgi:hypothetical protein